MDRRPEQVPVGGIADWHLNLNVADGAWISVTGTNGYHMPLPEGAGGVELRYGDC